MRIAIFLFMAFSFGFVNAQSKAREAKDTWTLIHFNREVYIKPPMYKALRQERDSSPKSIQHEIIYEGRRIHVLTEFVKP